MFKEIFVGETNINEAKAITIVNEDSLGNKHYLKYDPDKDKLSSWNQNRIALSISNLGYNLTMNDMRKFGLSNIGYADQTKYIKEAARRSYEDASNPKEFASMMSHLLKIPFKVA